MSFSTKGKPSATGKSYGRKPYVVGPEGDYTEMMSRVPRRAMEDQATIPRSQFDKPYLNDDYAEMEHFQPMPSTNFAWPDLVFPDFSGPVPDPNVDLSWVPKGAGGGIPCLMSLIGPMYCEPGAYPDWSYRGSIYLSLVNLNFLPSLGDFLDNVRVYINGSRYHNVTTGGSGRCGAGYLCIEKPPGGWVPGDKIYVDVKDAAKANFGQSLCSQVLIVACIEEACDCDSPPEGVFAFDDGSTSDTITPGSSISVYVTGGCPPFNWSVSGIGYNFTASNTQARNNVLRCSGGTCGPSFAAVADLTITDDCGDQVTAKILNTDGGWVEQSTGVCEITGVGTITGSGPNYTITYTTENKRQVHVYNYHEVTEGAPDPCGDSLCGTVDCSGSTWCDGYGLESEGSCLVGAYGLGWCACEQAAGDTCWCRRTYSLAYYEWGCP